MAVFSKGIPDFRSLEMRDQQMQSLRIDYLSKATPANYIVFDILYKGQKNLMELPLLERKLILKQELQENDFVTIIDYLQNDGEAYFKAALKKGLEGIMAKRLASSYQPGVRSSRLDQDQEETDPGSRRRRVHSRPGTKEVLLWRAITWRL